MLYCLPFSLLDAGVEVNSEQLLRKTFSCGEVVKGVVEQVRYIHPSHTLHTVILWPDLTKRGHFVQNTISYHFSTCHHFKAVRAIMLISQQVQSNGLQILLSPRAEGFVPLLRVSKSIEVCKSIYSFISLSIFVLWIHVGVAEFEEVFLYGAAGQVHGSGTKERLQEERRLRPVYDSL